jgi:hypothetical protein
VYLVTPRFNAADVLVKAATIDHAIVEARRLMRDPEAPSWLAVYDGPGRGGVIRVVAAHTRLFWVKLCPKCKGTGTTGAAGWMGAPTPCFCSDFAAGWGYLEDLPCE